MRKSVFVAAVALVLGLAPAAFAAEVTISCGAVGQELRLCREGAEAWARETGHSVTVVSTPASATERLALYQQHLAVGSPDIDVFQIDIVWPGLLAAHFIDLGPHLDDASRFDHFPELLDANTVDGRLVAVPWFTDAGLLYYRRDLLERYGATVPRTWQALTRTAARIQAAERAAGNPRMWGYVWQGRAYEGLTCNALEWIASHGGGTLIDDSGAVTVDNPRAAEALDLAASWVGGISPPGVLNYQEEEARGVFQSGNAVFMRNWPYAWSLVNGDDSPVRGAVGVSALPKGGADGRPVGTLGGQQLAVSKYSANVDAAVDLVMYLTSADEQRRRAIAGSFNPTRGGVYLDVEVMEANPFFTSLKDVFVNAVARPSTAAGPAYGRLSSDFWNAVHATLAAGGGAADRLEALETKLDRTLRGAR